MLEKLENKFTRYEIARILGARSLQLAMDAPVLLKLSPEEEKELNFDTLKIAEKELLADVLPITVRRPLPKKSEKLIKKLTDKEIKEKLEKEAKEKGLDTKSASEKKEISEDAEIMEMANPEDEGYEETEESSGEEEIV
jgi:DNA-directed RNA polymerase subunit K